MRVAYVSVYDARDLHNWSGTGTYIAQALERQDVPLEYVGSLREPFPLVYKAKQLLYRTLQQRHLRDREPGVLRAYARQAARRLAGIPHDVVFGPGNAPLAHLETEKPIAFWADATFAGLTSQYPAYQGLSAQTLVHGDAMERAALARSSLAIYASDWAAQTAIEAHGADPCKVRVVPFGANVTGDRSLEDIRAMVRSRPRDRCKLLFLGVEWQRKGGEIALELARTLNREGLATDLTIVGCRPEVEGPLPDYVRTMGFISKATAGGRAQLDRLLAESHFLVLPSRAECFGVVFCEASSFGVPSLATRVGGIPTAVRDGMNGQLFDLEAPSSAYATFVLDLFADYGRYEALALSAFDEFERRLNWQVSGRIVKRLLSELG